MQKFCFMTPVSLLSQIEVKSVILYALENHNPGAEHTAWHQNICAVQVQYCVSLNTWFSQKCAISCFISVDGTILAFFQNRVDTRLSLNISCRHRGRMLAHIFSIPVISLAMMTLGSLLLLWSLLTTVLPQMWTLCYWCVTQFAHHLILS